MRLASNDPLAVAAMQAIRSGDLTTLKHLLTEHPLLASARILDPNPECGCSRTLLHVVTDWPGHFPNGAETVLALIEAGAAVNARFDGRHGETPLHWAASCDDVAVLDALLDQGANIEVTGAVIGQGTPLADATAFGQWNAARRLIERGARATLWQASALGLMDRIAAFFAGDCPPSADEITNAFWTACHGGQREAAEYLLARGADLHWVGYDGLTPIGAARRSGAQELVDWLISRGASRD